MATDMKRISISLSDAIDEKVMEMKRTEEYCRSSYAEIIRILIERGIAAEKKEA